MKLSISLQEMIQTQNDLVLRPYQVPIAEAVFDCVINRRGLSLVVVLPRQSGKNELQAQLEALLLTGFMDIGGEMVKISPTWKPQTHNAMRRLERVLRRSPMAAGWACQSGYIYRLGEARLTFLSGSPETNIVGATASLMLCVDEAQDIQIEKYDREIAPMAASTNATRVFWGTAWSSQTLLGRELRAALAAEQRDGIRRTFVMDADAVMAEVPAYAAFVNEQIARLGRGHPLVRTQYFSEEIDGQTGLFPPDRLARMQGDHPAEDAPVPGALYAVLVDVAGEAVQTGAGSPDQMTFDLPGMDGFAGGTRDSSAATVVRIDLNGVHGCQGAGPVYRVVARRLWTGIPHTRLYNEIKALAENFQAARVVIDATGIGAGLASFLTRALGSTRVRRFLFTASSKSQLGWDFLAQIETGRFKDHVPPANSAVPNAILQSLFLAQAAACSAQASAGQSLRWGVPDSARHPLTRGRLHDDLLISAALSAVLDQETWHSAVSGLAGRADPLESFRKAW